MTRFCASGTQLRLDWPDSLPFDTRVRLDRTERDPARLTSGDCIEPGAHRLDVETTFVTEGRVSRHADGVSFEAALGDSIVLLVEPGPAPSGLAFGGSFTQGESVIAGECPVFSPSPDAAVHVVVASLPERSHRIRLTRVRLALDGILVLDRDGSATERGEPEPELRHGLIAAGEHVLSIELTYAPARWGIFSYAYSYVYRVRRDERVRIPAAGAFVRVRSGDRGRITQPIEDGLFLEVEIEPAGIDG